MNNDEELNIDYSEGKEELEWLNMEMEEFDNFDMDEFDYIDFVDMNLIDQTENIENTENTENTETEENKSGETRQQKIDRYMYKRTRRCWNSTKGYEIRSRFANSRPRHKGRFLPVAKK